ncbi:DUF502 domain-containing protein [Kineobactrum sediminis]|nr:DUF502 domain-containing protein [Kineobactrum sediminis]
MKRLASLALRGLVAVLPVALTIYLVYWLLAAMESVAGTVLRTLLPEEWYFAGMGLVSAVLLLIATGILVDAYVIRHLLRLGDVFLSRIPLVKSVHGAIQDVLRAFSITKESGADSVVLVEVQDNMRLIGFVTARDTAKKLIPNTDSGEDIIGVYLPMSYQLGGYTVYLPASKVQPLKISVEEAMRIAVTGGIQSNSRQAG